MATTNAQASNAKSTGGGAKSAKKKTRKNLSHGVCHIHASFNNTIVTISDADVNAVVWASVRGKSWLGKLAGKSDCTAP